MVNHEKKAFWKFFLTYFVSVALLILASGYFYFSQMKLQLLKAEHFSLIEYARHIKMQKSLREYPKDEFHFSFVKEKEYIGIRNFQTTQQEFSKLIPTKMVHTYLKVVKSKKHYEQKIKQLRYKIVAIQLFLLFVFASISYFLARSALKPLHNSIETLDKFTKDLIHDLNTPVTAMQLNLRLLQKEPKCQESRAFERLQKSVAAIGELRSNLTILLENKTFQRYELNLCSLVRDVVELHQTNYPHLRFIVECSTLKVKSNENALKQILHNLISNACKYNKEDGYVRIYAEKKRLCIEDSGVGIEDASRIFERDFSTHNSSGIGLDIVKRLCEAMDIEIKVISSDSGSSFFLTFR